MNNTPFYIFLSLVGVFCLAVLYLFHEIIKKLPEIMAEHARIYARAYVKATCLILLSSGTAFKETFANLTPAQAAAMTWWEWASMFWMPIAAGIGVILAFLDTSVAAAKDQKVTDLAGGTRSPFVKTTSPTGSGQPAQ